MRLLPTPRRVNWLDGEFRLPNPLPIHGDLAAARVLAERLLLGAGVRTVAADADTAAVRFHHDPTLAPEAYRLSVGPDGVAVHSADDAGASWAVQTLLQLLPVQVYGPGPMDPASLVAPAVEIFDEPAFGWRASHIDVARHFLPLDGLLRHLEVMAAHKLNVLHFHLTDDQGWRIPIAKYPELTRAGAWRPGSLAGHQPPPDENDRDDVAEHDGRPHGGAYTVDEIRQVVRRAGELGILVMPEIDMPGHMESVLAAYPELGACRHVEHPRTAFGVSHHVLQLSERAVEFCTDVLDEVMALFPGAPIHIGGDECPSAEWFEDPVSLATMAEHGITTGAEAQAWFERRICEHVLAAGRRVVAWDEVLEMGAPDGVTVMVWRDQADIAAATARGFDVIASPVRTNYLDYAQYDTPGQPLTIDGPTPLERTAEFAQVFDLPPEQREHLIGGQLLLWTEYVHNWASAEYQMWPRGSAIAQQLWAGEQGDEGTLQGLGRHLDRLTAMQLNWCRPPGGQA